MRELWITLNSLKTRCNTATTNPFQTGAQANQRPPGHPARSLHPQMQCRVQPCTCSLQPTISAMRASRSTAPACRCICFTSLRFHSAPFAQPAGRECQLKPPRTACLPLPYHHYNTSIFPPISYICQSQRATGQGSSSLQKRM